MKALARHGALGIIGVVFSAVGLVSGLVAAALAWDLRNDRATHVHAPGVVVGKQKRCSRGCSWHPVVEFQADGATAQVVGVVGNAWPALDKGDAVTVLYPPGAPDEARIDHVSETGFGIAFGIGFLLIFGGIGLPMLFLTVRRAGGERWARAHGLRVQARLLGVERDTRIRVNGRSPYRIVAEWRSLRDGRAHRLVSAPLWTDPAPHLQGRAELPARLDPERPARYWLDLSFLPGAAD